MSSSAARAVALDRRTQVKTCVRRYYSAAAIWGSALYATRELAMDPALFRAASAANGFACALRAVAAKLQTWRIKMMR